LSCICSSTDTKRMLAASCHNAQRWPDEAQLARLQLSKLQPPSKKNEGLKRGRPMPNLHQPGAERPIAKKVAHTAAPVRQCSEHPFVP